MESKTPVHRARYCGLFAAVGSLKMPSGTLFLGNRGRREAFNTSTGRGHTGCTASAPEMHCLCLLNAPPPPHEIPRSGKSDILQNSSVWQ